ncbi:hypothetical protein QIX46_19745 [Lysinibacillus boronitolerans]|nr:hypothetical protein QIX46_19745 [Lysinibacillus boronitolerans]
MKKFLKNLFRTTELPTVEPIFRKPTIILKLNVYTSAEKIKEMEDEYSQKMNVNVVILDGKFSDDIKVI